MKFRVCVNMGDVVKEGKIYMGGVNIAARLESHAQPDGICISKVFTILLIQTPFYLMTLGSKIKTTHICL